VTRLTVIPDAQAAAEFAASEIARVLREALDRRGVAHLALAGGDTPRPAYRMLASLLEDWGAVELWYGDERCVEPDDPESNHRLVAEALRAHIVGVAPREHRMRGELGPEVAAQEYAGELRAGVAPAEKDGVPALDVALLGIGEDGHTASLFPDHPEVNDSSGALCLPVRNSPKPPPERVTLSLPVLRAARYSLLLVVGSAKAEALGATLAGGGRGPDQRVPASLLASERLHVVADAAAAARIDSSDSC
jgi:6-phosphogluconolactonase